MENVLYCSTSGECQRQISDVVFSNAEHLNFGQCMITHKYVIPEEKKNTSYAISSSQRDASDINKSIL